MEEQQAKKEETIQISKTTLWQIISGVFLVLLVISIFTGGFGFGSGNEITGGAVVNPGDNNVPSLPKGIAEVSADDDAVLGDKDAPVEIIEFSDFQCPFCRKFWTETFDQLKTNYIDTGKVKLVYRDFPLESLHPMAQKSAEAAECADDQGKFWEYHDKMYGEQNIIDSGSVEGPVKGTAQYTVDDLKKWAKDIGLDSSEFDACLDDGKYEDEVNKDFQDGGSAGVQGTPSFFINGKQLSGAQPYSAFQAAIESELA